MLSDGIFTHFETKKSTTKIDQKSTKNENWNFGTFFHHDDGVFDQRFDQHVQVQP